MGEVTGLAIIPFMIGIFVLAAVAVVLAFGVLACLVCLWVKGVDTICALWRRFRG